MIDNGRGTFRRKNPGKMENARDTKSKCCLRDEIFVFLFGLQGWIPAVKTSNFAPNSLKHPGKPSEFASKYQVARFSSLKLNDENFVRFPVNTLECPKNKRKFTGIKNK